LDSGTTLTYLPAQIVSQLVDAAGATYDSRSDIYLLACDKSDANATLNYQFGGPAGPTIKVPFSELVLPVRNSNGEFLQIDGEQYCVFGVKESEGINVFLFGDTFLRSAYVVYDLDGKTIGLAQAITQSTESNIIEITGPVEDGLQGASSVLNQPTAPAIPTSRNTGIGGTFETRSATSPPIGSGNPSFTFGATGGATSRATGRASTSSSGAINPIPTFDWSSFMVVVGTMFMTLLGGGIFVLL